LQDPKVKKKLFEHIPPKQGDIRHKVVLYTEEKRELNPFAVREVQNEIARRRINNVLEVFHDMDMGYQTDVWDLNIY